MSASATQRTPTPSGPGWPESVLRRLSSFPFLLPALIIYAVFALYPMVDGLWLSFFDWDGVSGDRNWVGLENYVQSSPRIPSSGARSRTASSG